MAERRLGVGIVGLGYVGGAIRFWFESSCKDKYDLHFYDKYKEIGSVEEVNRADIVFVAVPTPFGDNGYDDSAVKETLGCIKDGKIVVIKSTILPGSTDAFQRQFPQKTILFNPEFLLAKSANQDFVNPARQIVGYANIKGKEAAKVVLSILPNALFSKVVKAQEAEMIKYFGNAYLATRVVFANQIYDLCEKLGGVNYDIVKECLVQDKRIGDSHFEIFHDGYRGYSGACFPKDVKALLQLGRALGVKLDLIEAADRVNAELVKKSK